MQPKEMLQETKKFLRKCNVQSDKRAFGYLAFCIAIARKCPDTSMKDMYIYLEKKYIGTKKPYFENSMTWAIKNICQKSKFVREIFGDKKLTLHRFILDAAEYLNSRWESAYVC